MSHHSQAHRTHCQNCDSRLTGPYCSVCGQRDIDYSGSFWHILEDALEGALHFDGKFFKSATFIFTRPGFLTKEFIAGRRSRYMHPIRMYVFASFLFFTVSVLTSRTHPLEDGRASVSKTDHSIDASTRKLSDAKGSANGKAALNVAADTVVQGKTDEHSWLDARLQVKVDPRDKVNGKELSEEFWHLMPETLILCLPFLALVLKLVYMKSKRAYFDHLIFALHIQAFAFLSFILIWLGGSIGAWWSKEVESAVGALLLLGMFYLIYRAFRVVYMQSPIQTVVRFLIVLIGYVGILLVAFLALGVAAEFLLARNSSH